MKSDAWLDEVCGGYPGDFGPNPTWRSQFPLAATAWDAAGDIGTFAWEVAKGAAGALLPTGDASTEPPRPPGDIPDVAQDFEE